MGCPFVIARSFCSNALCYISCYYIHIVAILNILIIGYVQTMFVSEYNPNVEICKTPAVRNKLNIVSSNTAHSEVY
jgi:hypothetical protein